MKNILIIQLTRLGDIIQSLPLVKDLRVKYSDAKINILISDVFKECHFLIKEAEVIPINLDEFVLNNGVIENEYFNSMINDLNTKKFDKVINLNNSPISKCITKKIICNIKIGFGQSGFSTVWTAYITSFLKTRLLNSINLVDLFKIIEANDKLVSEENKSKITNKTIESNKKIIGLQCGARNIKRQFTTKQYTDITEHYLQQKYKIYLFGVANESKTASEIKQVVKSEDIIDLTGKTDLKQLSEKICECERIYSPDTGTMHLAAYLGIPVTALFCGPAYPFETLAYSENINVFMPDSTYFSCYPCNDDNHCVNNYKCKQFSFQTIFNNQINKEFIKLTVGRDELGQVLFPIDERAKLWRIFTKQYFFKIKGDFFVSEKLNKTISRVSA